MKNKRLFLLFLRNLHRVVVLGVTGSIVLVLFGLAHAGCCGIPTGLAVKFLFAEANAYSGAVMVALLLGPCAGRFTDFGEPSRYSSFRCGVFIAAAGAGYAWGLSYCTSTTVAVTAGLVYWVGLHIPNWHLFLNVKSS